MDEETRAGFAEIREIVRLGFAEMNRRFEAVALEIGTLAHDVGTLRHDVTHDVGTLRHDVGTLTHDVGTLTHDVGTLTHDVGTLTHDVGTLAGEVQRNGVLIEDLRAQIQAVAEGERANAQAIERLRAEMNERFRENEIVVGAAFRQIRRDIDELRDRR